MGIIDSVGARARAAGRGQVLLYPEPAEICPNPRKDYPETTEIKRILSSLYPETTEI